MQRISSLAVVAAMIGGCASWFMNGGKLVKQDYAAPVRVSFTIPTCQMNDGSVVNGPKDVVFQLVQEPNQLAIFERGADGTGAVITNSWSDAIGDHYFGWVQAQGWEYIIPRNPAHQPVRRVYVNLKVGQEGSVTKPLTSPAGVCPMVPLQQAGATQPTGYPAQPPAYPQPQPQPGAYPQPQPGAYPQPQPGAYPQPQPGAYPPPQPGAYPPPQPGAYPPPQPGAYPPPQPGAYPQPQPGAYPPPQPGAYPQPQPGAYPPPQPGASP